MNNVVVLIGAGQIGQAIARRVGVAEQVVLADVRHESATAAADAMANAAHEASVETVDASSREAVHALVEAAIRLGDVTGPIHAAGASPSQASPATILKVDLYGTAIILEEFGNVIARGPECAAGGAVDGRAERGCAATVRACGIPADDDRDDARTGRKFLTVQRWPDALRIDDHIRDGIPPS
jgi:NAD(P)-dependent dehydrogenase (short-subunit alcohol dehydrogenase family)